MGACGHSFCAGCASQFSHVGIGSRRKLEYSALRWSCPLCRAGPETGSLNSGMEGFDSLAIFLPDIQCQLKEAGVGSPLVVSEENLVSGSCQRQYKSYARQTFCRDTYFLESYDSPERLPAVFPNHSTEAKWVELLENAVAERTMKQIEFDKMNDDEDEHWVWKECRLGQSFMCETEMLERYYSLVVAEAEGSREETRKTGAEKRLTVIPVTVLRVAEIGNLSLQKRKEILDSVDKLHEDDASDSS